MEMPEAIRHFASEHFTGVHRPRTAAVLAVVALSMLGGDQGTAGGSNYAGEPPLDKLYMPPHADMAVGVQPYDSLVDCPPPSPTGGVYINKHGQACGYPVVLPPEALQNTAASNGALDNKGAEHSWTSLPLEHPWATVALAGTLLLPPTLGLGLWRVRRRRRNSENREQLLRQQLSVDSLPNAELRGRRVANAERDALDLYAEYWPDTQLKPKEKRRLLRAIRTLPPVGSKVILDIAAANTDPLKNKPELTAEYAARKSIDQIGSVCVQQTTVQGRLPDPVKYAAMGILLTSPYKQDWAAPFYRAPWGKVGPIIHDGGNTHVYINPQWERVRGRTDFIQNIFLGDAAVNPSKRIDSAIVMPPEARHNLNMIFFQRAALALHCESGTAPKSINTKTLAELSFVWLNYQQEMTKYLQTIGLDGVNTTRWFESEASLRAHWPDGRYEGNFADIASSLRGVAQAHELHGAAVSETVTTLMLSLISHVDRAIGLVDASGESLGLVHLQASGLPTSLLEHIERRPTRLPGSAPPDTRYLSRLKEDRRRRK